MSVNWEFPNPGKGCRRTALAVLAAVVVGSAGLTTAAASPSATRITRPYTIIIKHPHRRTIAYACHTASVRRGTLTATRCLPAIIPPRSGVLAAFPATNPCGDGFDLCILSHPHLAIHFPPPPLLTLMEATINVTSGDRKPRNLLVLLAFFRTPLSGHKFAQVGGCVRQEPLGLAGKCQWTKDDLPKADRTTAWHGFVDCQKGRWYTRWSFSGHNHAGTLQKQVYYWPNFDWNTPGKNGGDIHRPPTISQAFQFHSCAQR